MRVCSVLGCCLIACLFVPETVAAKEKKEAIDQQVREMVMTSRRLLDLRMEEYRNGTADYLVVLRARRQLLALELRLAADAEERQVALKRQLEAAMEYEELIRQRLEAGQGSRGALLEARLERMAIELRVLEEAE